jgi:hypothetical protein
MSAAEDATERTRLLDSESGLLDGDVQEHGSADHDDEHVANETPLAKEASTKELLAVMAAIWMGVFFAALGNIAGMCITARRLLIHPQIRPSSPPSRHPYRPNSNH